MWRWPIAFQRALFSFPVDLNNKKPRHARALVTSVDDLLATQNARGDERASIAASQRVFIATTSAHGRVSRVSPW